MLSFRKASSGSIPKVDAAETAKEKAAFHINTKADPTKAINEAQPGMLLPRHPPNEACTDYVYSGSQCARGDYDSIHSKIRASRCGRKRHK